MRLIYIINNLFPSEKKRKRKKVTYKFYINPIKVYFPLNYSHVLSIIYIYIWEYLPSSPTIFSFHLKLHKTKTEKKVTDPIHSTQPTS